MCCGKNSLAQGIRKNIKRGEKIVAAKGRNQDPKSIRVECLSELVQSACTGLGVCIPNNFENLSSIL